MRRIALVLSIAIAGCGGAGGGVCGSAGAVTCSKACACRTDGTCAILVPSSGGIASTLSFASANDCNQEAQLVCGNSPAVKTVDFNACQSGLQTAACAPDPSHAGLQALNLPAACAPLW